MIRESSISKLPKKTFSFGTLVTNIEEYKRMVASAKSAGFDDKSSEFLYLDNSIENKYDGFSGFNHLNIQATGKYLIFCHQDIIFNDDDKNVLIERISEIETIDPNWGLIGNAGYTKNCHRAIRISDKNFDNITLGILPQRVVSLDENFMILNRASHIVASANMDGFHLYGIDICLNAKNFGYNSYVINFHITHTGAGSMGQHYEDTQKKFIQIVQQRKKTQILLPMCSQFFVSSSKIITSLLNQKWLINLYKSLSKKKNPIKSLF